MSRILPVLSLAVLAAVSGLAPSSPSALAAGVREGATPDLDSARAEFAVGRYWHAARHLEELRGEGLAFGPGETLLLARAQAGYHDWDGVLRTLGDAGWLAEEEGGLGLRVLARALEAREEWPEAAAAYGRYLVTRHGLAAGDRAAVRARRVRSLARIGVEDVVTPVLDTVAAESPIVASWMALEVAEARAADGDTAMVRSVLARVSDADARDRAWRLEASAALAAGDTAAALRLYADLAAPERSAARRAVALGALGDLALAAGDTAGAVERYRTALDLGPWTSAGAEGARRLVELDSLSPGRALAAARALERAGADRPALAAYDLHLRSAADPGEEVRLARARLMAATPGRRDEAVAELRALSTSETPAVGARALEVWAGLRRRQGRSGDVRTIREWLVERYPSSPQAVEVVFFRADALQDRLELDAALASYGRLQEMAPSLNLAGLGRMRTAQIHLGRGDSTRAVEAFRGYLADFPEGRRWEEAAYWAGRLLLARRDSTGAGLLEDVQRRSPLSYYAVLASEALGTEYRPPGMAEGDLPPLPGWMGEELHTVDLLVTAGLDEGRAVRTERLVRRALDGPADAALRLARELVDRDLTLDGINLGWELRGRGMDWSRALLEVLYPFPHREMVYRAARARGLDPILVASIIRQESAFDPAIVSRAGAVGLMQVMPATGGQIAAAEGPRDFDPESLVTPEINLHLGTRYLVDLLDRFDRRLPFVLAAYNAGPSRADAWKAFPEADDPYRFTERIPFAETRDYVKQIARNLALYGALYGGLPAS